MRSNFFTRTSGKWAGGLCFAALLAVASRSVADIMPTIITGGEPSGGWTAPASPLFAYNLGTAASQTIQGVTFAGWDDTTSLTAPTNGAGITVTVNAGSNESNYLSNPPVYSNPDPGGAMASMMSLIFYNYNGGAGPLSFTMTGLTAGQSYLVDAFTYSDGASTRNDETFTVNGAEVAKFNQVQDSYLVPITATAFNNGITGEIDLSITSGSLGTPILSGLVVSAVPVPEPSSIALLGLGGVFLLTRWRKRSGR